MRTSIIAALTTVIELASVSHSQHALPFPSPDPNPHFPDELGGGLLAGIRSAGVSEHTRCGVSWVRGGSRVIVEWNEKSPVDGTWYKTKAEESVTYSITGLDQRNGGTILYLAGVRYDGSKVIQKWTYSVRDGGFAIVPANSAPPAPIGTPQPPFEAVEVVNGSDFVPPDALVNPSPASVRQVLWSGATVGVISSVVADPEGRFLLLLSYPDGNLYRLNLGVPSPVPDAIASSVTDPFLAAATNIMLVFHSSQGRRLIVSRVTNGLVSADRLLFGDANNDGNFDPGAYLTGAQWSAAGYNNEVWNSYWNTGVAFDW
jgi:hypothetical protein